MLEAEQAYLTDSEPDKDLAGTSSGSTPTMRSIHG
jgi:hypothetical protein